MSKSGIAMDWVVSHFLLSRFEFLTPYVTEMEIRFQGGG